MADATDANPLPRARPGGSVMDLGVHVLSEHRFCPRAAILALESGQDSGDVEPDLGTKLDAFADYDAHRFAEELALAWGRLRLWLTLLAPAALLVLVAWQWHSPLAGLALSLPVFYLLGQMWETLMRIVDLIRERTAFNAAPPLELDLAPKEIQKVNWWSLRKAGFDCLKPIDANRDPVSRLTGQPWRLLTKGTTLRIPVVRKHRGNQTYGPQHIVRNTAYCRLVELCEGGEAPFGILMFAGTYDCLMIPNDVLARIEFEDAFEKGREFLQVYQQGEYEPIAPTDNRCSGCHFGKPRRLAPGSETILKDEPLAPAPQSGRSGKSYHSTCGDRFRWVPPHEDAQKLQLVSPR